MLQRLRTSHRKLGRLPGLVECSFYGPRISDICNASPVLPVLADARCISSSSAVSFLDYRRLNEVPAIIGHELLVSGAAQDALKLMDLRGNDIILALDRPISQLLGEDSDGPLIRDAKAFREIKKALDDFATICQAHEMLDEADEDEQDTVPENPDSIEVATKRTYQPSTIIRKRRHGFLARLKSVGGRKVLKRRRRKGRRKLSA